eukprot:scaffold2043_cov149-Skeletonema_menzelii.AAC.7
MHRLFLGSDTMTHEVTHTQELEKQSTMSIGMNSQQTCDCKPALLELDRTSPWRQGVLLSPNDHRGQLGDRRRVRRDKLFASSVDVCCPPWVKSIDNDDDNLSTAKKTTSFY